MPVPLCIHCDEPVLPGEQADCNQPNHEDCLLRAVAGSLAHQQRRCGCYVLGSIEGDPPGLSRREAAKQAADYFRRQAS